MNSVRDRFDRDIKRGTAYFVSGKFDLDRIFITSCDKGKINFVNLRDGRVSSFSKENRKFFIMTSDFNVERCESFTELNLKFAIIHDSISGRSHSCDTSLYTYPKLLKLFKKGETLN